MTERMKLLAGACAIAMGLGLAATPAAAQYSQTWGAQAQPQAPGGYGGFADDPRGPAYGERYYAPLDAWETRSLLNQRRDRELHAW